MINIDNKIRILWLSDIHYSYKYEGKRKTLVMKNALEQFFAYLENENKKIIDYVLISGDIAQEGLKRDYRVVKDELLLKIKATLPGAKFLIVPGNHDVRWEKINDLNKGAVKVNFYEVFLNGIRDLDINTRYSLLGKRKPEFEALFADFSEELKDFSDATHTSDNLLYGYTVDEDKKVIFILFNSSWYSITNKLVESVVNDFAKAIKHLDKRKAKYREIKKAFEKDIFHLTSDYGKQIIAVEKLHKDFIKKIEDLTTNFNDYLLISTCHHPLNWLDWFERYSSENDKREFSFKEVKDKTDILLTGHEHVPTGVRAEYLLDRKLLHIPGGCFFEHKGYTVDKPINHKHDKWFSILNININKRTIKQEKIKYDETIKDWKPLDSEPAKTLYKDYYKPITEDRKKIIIEKKISFEKIIKLIRKNDDGGIQQTGSISKIEDSDVMYYLKKKSIYINIQSISSGEFSGNNIGCFNLLDIKRLVDLINVIEIEYVHFVFLDRDHPKFDNYLLADDRLKVLRVIKDNLDFLFDKFRYSFFEEEYVKKELENSNKLFYQLKFVNLILPYWKYESFLID